MYTVKGFIESYITEFVITMAVECPPCGFTENDPIFDKLVCFERKYGVTMVLQSDKIIVDCDVIMVLSGKKVIVSMLNDLKSIMRKCEARYGYTTAVLVFGDTYSCAKAISKSMAAAVKMFVKCHISTFAIEFSWLLKPGCSLINHSLLDGIMAVGEKHEMEMDIDLQIGEVVFSCTSNSFLGNLTGLGVMLREIQLLLEKYTLPNINTFAVFRFSDIESYAKNKN